ncbi:hypothetical protein WICPIJ_006219 [Wickerhamomyces pijperi]|uniref:Peptidase M48 domain-containing protein n=1 Tax=Wickerhamomyces pijperi TaxID=599730 RepID=A0A9P8Q237_WICPI|nr:hypothetical protein WICPIJ_006219 [Wickerhamomyces pijperi]
MFRNTLSSLAKSNFRFTKLNPTNSHKFNYTPTLRSYATYRRFNNQVSNTNLLKDPKSRRYVLAFLSISGLIYVSNLHEAPVTGRKRFIWTPVWLEEKIGNQSYRQLLNQYNQQGQILPASHPTTKKVASIFKRILDVSPVNADQLDWKIHVIVDPNAPPNAFVLPGGKVFVFSSILSICQNDDGLATVLSHEFAHQLARHTGENLSSSPIYGMIGLFLYTVTGSDLINRLIMNAIFTMPASRQMETEADYIGLMLMSKACFNPSESYKLWERMAQYEKQKSSGMLRAEFLSTHPSSDTRIENMKEWQSKARQAYDQSHCEQFGQFWGDNGVPGVRIGLF